MTKRQNTVPLWLSGLALSFGIDEFIDLSMTSPSSKDATPLGLGGDLRLSNGTWVGMYATWDPLSGKAITLANLKFSKETRPDTY